MTLIELLFFIVAILCAIAGANYFGHWGFLPGVGGAAAGLIAPFLLIQMVARIDDARFSRTRQGRRRSLAEDAFDKSMGKKRHKSRRPRPEIGQDGSTVVTIYYGYTRTPCRAFYRFDDDSMEPQQITPEEAARLIMVRPLR